MWCLEDSRAAQALLLTVTRSLMTHIHTQGLTVDVPRVGEALDKLQLGLEAELWCAVQCSHDQWDAGMPRHAFLDVSRTHTAAAGPAGRQRVPRGRLRPLLHACILGRHPAGDGGEVCRVGVMQVMSHFLNPSEYLWNEGAHLFWAFVEAMAASPLPESDQGVSLSLASCTVTYTCVQPRTTRLRTPRVHC